MEFKYFSPSDCLKPYIRHYYLFVSDSDLDFEDTVFPSGEMEVIFNLGEGTWESSVGNKFFQTPPIELWGQITKPLAIRSKGRHTMFGIKFLTHSAACFFNQEVGMFNNQVADLADVIGRPVRDLHSRLLETNEADRRIALIESFLLKRVAGEGKRSFRVDKIANILTSIKKDAAENNISVIALRHGISSRYLHKLIYQHTGLSPKSYNKISRFQHSLRLITKNELPLTSIAYDCGYFDQSHFIRDFKSFTGVTPSGYLGNKFPVNQVFQ